MGEPLPAFIDALTELIESYLKQGVIPSIIDDALEDVDVESIKDELDSRESGGGDEAA